MRKLMPLAVVCFVLLMAGAAVMWGQDVVQVVSCPYCGEDATFTGARKLTGNNTGSVCEYSHLYIGTDGQSVKHTFWHDCEGK